MKRILALLLVAASVFITVSYGNTTSTKQTSATTQSTPDYASTLTIVNPDTKYPSYNLEPYANINFTDGTMTEENGGLTLEVLYIDNSSLNAVRGIVCCTESIENGRASTRSGWGIAEDNGKPYFIVGNSDSNTYISVYSQSEASKKELVHVVAIFDSVHEQISLYVNGALHSTKKTSGRFTSANKKEYFEKFNMANIFYIGSDPTAQNRPGGDYPADNLTIADVKIYAKALSTHEAMLAYSQAVMMFD